MRGDKLNVRLRREKRDVGIDSYGASSETGKGGGQH